MKKKISKFILIPLLICSTISVIALSVKAEENRIDRTIPQTKENASGTLKEKQAQLREKIESKKDTLKEKALEKAKTRIANIIEKTIKKLERIKKRVANMKAISGDLKTELNITIDRKISTLNKIKNTAQTATTKEELESAMNSFREELKNTKNIIKDSVEAIHTTHLENIIEKIEALVPKIEKRIEDIPDPSLKKEAEELISKTETQLAEAKTQLASGSLEDARKTTKEAFRNIKYALEIVKDKEVAND